MTVDDGVPDGTDKDPTRLLKVIDNGVVQPIAEAAGIMGVTAGYVITCVRYGC